MTDKALEAAARALFLVDYPKDDWGRFDADDYHPNKYRAKASAAISAYFSALPGEAEVVARLRKLTSPDAEMLSDGYRLTEIIKLNPADALQPMQARAEAAEEANKALMDERTNLIETKRQQIDRLELSRGAASKVALDAIERAEAAEARVKELEEALKPFASDDAMCAANSDYCRARTALTGGSNG